MNGWELDELHNVYINTGTLANNDALIYESSTQLWKNKTIATALGFTPENVANKQSAVTTNANHYYNAPYINSIIKPNDIIICDTTNAAFTNQSANFILKSYLIAANTFAVGDVLRWFWSQQKTTTSNTIIHRLYINNSASLVGAVEIFRYDAAAAARDYTMARFQPHFSDATTLKSPSVTSGVVGITDIISINSLSTRSDTWDIATQKYLILAINPLALGDVFTFQSFTLERIRI
jgi:hypothetical protein